MREIKFRAWDKFRGKMVYDSVSSYMSFNDDGTLSYHFQATPMQYTGLKDKNGKEIYEGDIVKHNWSENDNWAFTHKVYFENGAFGYWAESTEQFISYERNNNSGFEWKNGQSEFIEVIGNIYENPELSNSEQKVQECDAT